MSNKFRDLLTATLRPCPPHLHRQAVNPIALEEQFPLYYEYGQCAGRGPLRHRVQYSGDVRRSDHGQAKGVYMFFMHLKWTWAIVLGYALGILTHIWINEHLFGVPV